jgi:hypothetical protein
MSIAGPSDPTSCAVQRGGTHLGGYSSSVIPPLRTAQGFHYVPVYKYLTPNGVKNLPGTVFSVSLRDPAHQLTNFSKTTA